MKITGKKLIGMNVFTESGTHVGKISDLICDTAHHAITHYQVKHGALTQKKSLLIHFSNVVRIEIDRMIVRDAFSFEEEVVKKEKVVPLQQVPAFIRVD